MSVEFMSVLQEASSIWTFGLGAVVALSSMNARIRIEAHKARPAILDAETRQLVVRCEQERLTRNNDDRLASAQLKRQHSEKEGEASGDLEQTDPTFAP